MRTVVRGSIQTIEHRAQLVSSFMDSKTEEEFFVRRLSGRVSPTRQLLIVTLNNDVHDGDVIPFAEVAMNNQKLRYVVGPVDQYPQYVNGNLPERIEAVIAQYMENHKGVNYHWKTAAWLLH